MTTSWESRSSETRSLIACLSHEGLDSFDFRRRAALRLAKMVPFDAFWWWTTDPATVIFTSAVLDPVPTVARWRLHVNEYVEPDFNKFRALARRRKTVGVLSVATDGRSERSSRYREILRPENFEHELRASLVSGTACWGALTLLRRSDRPVFSLPEADLVARITPDLAYGLRMSVLLGVIGADDSDDGPGLLLLDRRHQVVGMTAAAERWLAELQDWPSSVLPEVVSSIAAQSGNPEDVPAATLARMARVRTSSGRWLVVHGSTVDAAAGSDGCTAVILEPASPSQIAPLIVEAYGLSRRESEVARLVVRGLSTRAIAQMMRVSSYTVQDHLKSIFEKVAVRSRRELVTRIFAQGYWPWYGEGNRPTRSDGSADRTMGST